LGNEEKGVLLGGEEDVHDFSVNGFIVLVNELDFIVED
jgi:hypothetical protein